MLFAQPIPIAAEVSCFCKHTGEGAVATHERTNRLTGKRAYGASCRKLNAIQLHVVNELKYVRHVDDAILIDVGEGQRDIVQRRRAEQMRADQFGRND